MITADYLRAQRTAPGPAHLLSMLGQVSPLRYVPSSLRTRKLGTQSIIFDRRASIAVSALLTEDRRAVTFTLERLKRELVRGHFQELANRVKGMPETFLTRVRDFNILFVLNEGQIEVLDVFGSKVIPGIFRR